MKYALILTMAAILGGCQAAAPKPPVTASAEKPHQPAPDPHRPPVDQHSGEERGPIAADDPESWAKISAALGLKGTYARECYTITIPRDDLWVTADIGDIPTAAGLETNLHFFKCPCGRTSFVGRIVVADYEANDVIDELQTDGKLKIAALSPMFLRERPRVMMIHVQGEGEPEQLGKILKGALGYMGDQRLPARKLPDAN